MFEGLTQQIEKLSIPPDGDALAEALALRDRLDAKLLEALGAFDRAGLWDIEGATSMTAWLRDRAGMTRRTAAATVATARHLGSLPVTAAAFGSATLSAGQVETIVSAVNRHTVGLFAAQEVEVVPSLVPLSTTDTARAMQVWNRYATGDGTPPLDESGSVYLSPTLDGSGAIDGTLSTEGFALVKTALRVADTPDVDGEPARTPAQHRHDALVDICRHFLDHQHTRRGGRHRPHLNVVVHLDELDADRGGQVIDGPLLSGPITARLVCDSVIHRVVMTGRSTVLDYGTATRTWPVNLWNALVVRDQGCRFPGCDRPPEWCEAHHVTWVTDRGTTSIDNGVLTCSRHHHLVHQPGWTARLLPDGTYEVTDPTGRVRTTRPPGALLPAAA